MKVSSNLKAEKPPEKNEAHSPMPNLSLELFYFGQKKIKKRKSVLGSVLINTC